MKPQRIEDVLEFPCPFTFRIVADADDAILAGGADIDAILAGSPVEGDDDLLEG